MKEKHSANNPAKIYNSIWRSKKDEDLKYIVHKIVSMKELRQEQWHDAYLYSRIVSDKDIMLTEGYYVMSKQDFLDTFEKVEE